ncbi:hypothetical protein CALCODRAFT_447836, partial [Calocera cornea HHB12733]
MHAAWDTLLNSDFMEGYKNGFPMRCGDGFERRVFFRVFAYCADYPEKTLLATIRQMGGTPCPCCMVPKNEIFRMGSVRDKRLRLNNARVDNHARQYDVSLAYDAIYDQGLTVGSSKVEAILKSCSYLPVPNTFSKLRPLGFNVFDMLPVDLMHEIELRVWKSLLEHLIRILHAVGPRAIIMLDFRYLQVPTFGRGTIRTFDSHGVSKLSRLVAQDYEDLLQARSCPDDACCTIPVFEGLIPEPDNQLVMSLLYNLTLLHSLAKMCMVGGDTLERMDQVTTRLGHLMQRFQSETCVRYTTYELPKEDPVKPVNGSSGPQKRKRGCNLTEERPDTAPVPKRPEGQAAKNARAGELAHRHVKEYYRRSSKVDYVTGVAKIERRVGRLQRTALHTGPEGMLPSRPPAVADEDKAGMGDPATQYHMGVSTREWSNLTLWEHEVPNDRMRQLFTLRLKNHLLACLTGKPQHGSNSDFSREERAELLVLQNRLHWHMVCRINYTTYDVRHAQDTINLRRGQSDIMIPSVEDPTDTHPYWYARVIKIFHVNVLHAPSRITMPQRQDVLFVRWLGR